MAVRFMPDGRLSIETGALLDKGDRMDSLAATAAARAGMRTLLWSFPQKTDITSDRNTVESLLAKVEGPAPREFGARIYSHGGERILVIEHFH
jgi:hypothetical protein